MMMLTGSTRKLGSPLELYIVSSALLGEAGVADCLVTGATLELGLFDHWSWRLSSWNNWCRGNYHCWSYLFRFRSRFSFFYNWFWIRIIIFYIRVIILLIVGRRKEIL